MEGFVDQNDHLPDGPPGRVITIRLTRDTLILIVALVLLGLAIFLAVVSPSGEPNNVNTHGTSVAEASASAQTTPGTRSTTVPGAPTRAAYPFPQGTALAPSSETFPPGSYPEPSSNPNQMNPEEGIATSTPLQATTTTESSLQGTATVGPPTFDPSRPTVISGQPGPGTGYPAPAGTTAPPTPPIFGVATPPSTNQQPGPGGNPGSTSTLEPTTAPIPPSPTPPPTHTPNPATEAPAPTERPVATRTPRPPTPIPMDVLRGNVRWTLDQSPKIIKRDLRLVSGAALVIDPGVEVHFAPGVSFFVEGSLFAAGQPDQPVRLCGSTCDPVSQRWEGIFGRPGSTIVLQHTHLRGGGNGGTVLTSESGALSLRNAHINDNGGHIRVSSSRLEVIDSEIAGNDMPYGAALDISYDDGGGVSLINNRIGGNRMSFGAPPVQVANSSTLDTVNLDVQKNLLIGQNGPDLVLSTNGPLQGNLTCNTLISGLDGLSIRTQTLQVPGFVSTLTVRDNAIENHTPPIETVYLKYGIGRGATSEVDLDMRNNWWNSPLGPYEPDRHADGRGDAVGDNIQFDPWLKERPACTPR